MVWCGWLQLTPHPGLRSGRSQTSVCRAGICPSTPSWPETETSACPWRSRHWTGPLVSSDGSLERYFKYIWSINKQHISMRFSTTEREIQMSLVLWGIVQKK